MAFSVLLRTLRVIVPYGSFSWPVSANLFVAPSTEVPHLWSAWLAFCVAFPLLLCSFSSEWGRETRCRSSVALCILWLNDKEHNDVKHNKIARVSNTDSESSTADPLAVEENTQNLV